MSDLDQLTALVTECEKLIYQNFNIIEPDVKAFWVAFDAAKAALDRLKVLHNAARSEYERGVRAAQELLRTQSVKALTADGTLWYAAAANALSALLSPSVPVPTQETK